MYKICNNNYNILQINKSLLLIYFYNLKTNNLSTKLIILYQFLCYDIYFIIETIKIDFGRLPEWNCPIPDTDAKSVAIHNEVTTVQSVTDITTTTQSPIKEVNTILFL